MKSQTRKFRQLQLGLMASLMFFALNASAQYDTTEITGYRYDQFSSSDVASVDLYTFRNRKFAILVFLPVDESQLPAADLGNDGVIRMYYTRSRLHDVIDQLRNESPLRLNYWLGNPSIDNSHIGTMTIESVGENE